VIYGNAKEECLRPRVKPRTVWDRLLERKPKVVTPEWKAMGKDSHSIDLPVGNLSGIGTEFRDYIIKRFRKPWAATKTVIEYLKLGSIDVYLRRAGPENDPDALYIQLSFSGCGGMAQTSAELAVHWAVRWYREKRAEVDKQYFQPFGFVPSGGTEPTGSSEYFVPLGVGGYAQYDPRAPLEDESYPYSQFFCLDQAAMETLSETEMKSFNQAIDQKLHPMLPKDSCCCQWCNPGFDPTVCEKFVPF
jgi:hypothetical protein